MPNHHQARPDEWAQQTAWAQRQSSASSCIIELLHRIEALETAQHAHVSGLTPDAQQLTLVERVAKAIDEAPTEPEGWSGEARAAIRVVATAIKAEHYRNRDCYSAWDAACWLENEAMR